MTMDTSIINTPVARLSVGGINSPLRRRSLIAQKNRINREEERNDDDAERSSLVASERALVTSTPLASPGRSKDTMSSSPQKEHFQGCLKLYAENKINKDNAWNLQLIDFMTSMLRRHDARMDNLQTASTVVDASARIYSFRVDAVHYDVLKMAGGLSKAAQTKRGKKDDNDEVGDEPAADDARVKKKKKRAKGAIAPNPEVFNGDFDANDFVDPFFERLAATTGDVTSSNRAFNATLPIHDNTLALILRTDAPYLELIKENELDQLELTEHITLSAKLLPAFTSADRICEPFAGFSISNWDPDTEYTENRVNNWVEERLNLSQQALAFDVNAEVEPIPYDDAHNDLFEDEPLGGIESEEEADVAVAAAAAAACAARCAGAARVADMRPQAARDSRLEYSYCGAIVAAWAGPAHWRLRNNRASKLSERTQSTATGRLTIEKKAARSKRQLDFLGAGLATDCRAPPTGEYEPAQPAKITIARKTLATGHTWNEANYKTPIDRGLDETHFCKLFVRQNVTMRRRRALAASGVGVASGVGGAGGAEHEPLAVDDVRDYDYNNENDASYCPNSVPEGEEWGNEEGAAAGDPHDQLKAQEPEEIGDMLEPPTKVAKIFIPYAMRAKKVDMKQLKHCTWRMLTSKTKEGEKEEVTPTTFLSVYSRLPAKLSTNMRESLSVPLALLSVLHLANEKGLVLEKRDDLKDVGIIGLIK
ncbi:PREDICTED: condensin complex subunit 2 [Papilio xuthus]|uniref:Condensin complex subunit 2 n=1 Tax=Papilio xuthus TaxID=66420 RepID=A0AAJ7ED95_PAPXU|nr:PREDICTED: condensin complex subunit 2 [Papilio xuthus]